MTTFTAEKDALLIATAEHLVDLETEYLNTYETLCVALKRVAPIKAAQSTATPKPSAGVSVKEPEAIQPWLLDTTVKILKDERYAKQIAVALYGVPVAANAVEVILRAPSLLAEKIVEIERIRATKDRDTATVQDQIEEAVIRSEPKLAPQMKDENVERNARVQARFDELRRSNALYEALFQVVREEVERTDAADDKDTATVIADDDEKMAEIERLKLSADEDNDIIDQQRKIIVRQTKELDAIARLGIDSAADKARHAYYSIVGIQRRWHEIPEDARDRWRAVARAVYGLTSEGG